MNHSVFSLSIARYDKRLFSGESNDQQLSAIDSHLDETSLVISLREFESNKKYKEHNLQEVIVAICAMLNSNGGKVMIHFDTDSCIAVEDIPLKVIKILEHRMVSITGGNQTVSKINFKDDKDCIRIFIEKADFFITIHYNLYLPSQTQVSEVSPLEPPQAVKDDIMNRKVIPNAVELRSHCQTFTKDKNCGFCESKVCQLKYLKAEQSKRTTLADRITGKGNKFSCYVSAFANHRGGYIYYGIDDEGVVKGELIPDEKDKEEIIKKVEKAINKMIWPEQTGQPKRGEQWEIFFESVVDENSTPVPLTFVIVIYIASCLGGVFTEKPECYEMVEGKVTQMSFTTWKKRLLRPIWLCSKEKIPHSVSRVTWSSAAAQKAFTVRSEKLRKLINDGDRDAVSKECQSLQKDEKMKQLALSKQITASYRKGNFSDASSLLKKYMHRLPEVQDGLMFEVVGLHMEAALKRATGDFKGLENALTAALSKAELIEPGLVTAAVYGFAATVGNMISLEDKFSPYVLSMKTLEHLQRVKDCPHFCADKAQKAHMMLATCYLGCNFSGQLTKNKSGMDLSDLKKSKDSLMAVQQVTYDGNPLSEYRAVQLILVQSIYRYRLSQVRPDDRVSLLRSAFNYAEEAEYLSRKYNFEEMVECSITNKVLCTEELVRAKLTELEINSF